MISPRRLWTLHDYNQWIFIDDCLTFIIIFASNLHSMHWVLEMLCLNLHTNVTYISLKAIRMLLISTTQLSGILTHISTFMNTKEDDDETFHWLIWFVWKWIYCTAVSQFCDRDGCTQQHSASASRVGNKNIEQMQQNTGRTLCA